MLRIHRDTLLKVLPMASKHTLYTFLYKKGVNTKKGWVDYKKCNEACISTYGKSLYKLLKQHNINKEEVTCLMLN